ncbi:helix-turn-helix transcriptional regulator [Streptomyces sp. G5(2025)]|uniref:helix-turn-helix transcriptional regulator n=1 Tax=Streptomyces sp. G5(2025) TaxID=3406628 RepID=UPI003C24073A
MGRREELVPNSGLPHRAKLAWWLRDQRARAGLTYRDLGQRVYVHPGVLARAASGNVVSTWTTVEAYARGCGADIAQAQRLWRRARAEQHEPAQWSSGRAQRLRPEYLKDFRGLQLGLIALRRESGQLTLRELEEIAAAQGNHLPRSTVSAVLNGRAIPSESLTLAFVRACATQRRHVRVDLWMAAWQRAERDHQHHRYRSWHITDPEDVLTNRDATASSMSRGIRDLLDRHHRNGLSASELEEIAVWVVADWREQQQEAAYDNWLSQYEPVGA